MKKRVYIILFLILAIQTVSYGQANQTLPANSTPYELEPKKVFSGAYDMATKLTPLADELGSLIFMISFVFIVGNIKNSGNFQGIFESLLRFGLSVTLMTNFSDWIKNIDSVISNSSNQLFGTSDLMNQLGSFLSLGAASITISFLSLGFSTIALIVGSLIAFVVMFGCLLLQMAGKAFCIALAPIACACMASHQTHGFFSKWIKSFFIFSLMPFVWKFCLSLSLLLATGADASSKITGSFLLIINGVFLTGASGFTAWFINAVGSPAHGGMSLSLGLEKVAGIGQQFLQSRRGSIGQVGGGTTGGLESGKAMITEQFSTPRGTASLSYPVSIGGNNMSQTLGGKATPALEPSVQHSIERTKQVIDLLKASTSKS